MYREVAEHPGNTPTVAKESNVDPRMIELFTRGMTIDAELGSVDLSRVRELVERAAHDLLSAGTESADRPGRPRRQDGG